MYDKSLVFSDAQAFGAQGNLLSTGSYDTYQGKTTAADTPPIGGPLLNDIGRDHMPLFCQVDTTVTSGGAATVDFQLVHATSADLGTGLATIITSGAIALATLVAGYRPLPPVIPPGRVTKRYLGMRYVIATADTTAGSVTAWLGSTDGTNVNVI